MFGDCRCLQMAIDRALIVVRCPVWAVDIRSERAIGTQFSGSMRCVGHSRAVRLVSGRPIARGVSGGRGTIHRNAQPVSHGRRRESLEDWCPQ